MSVSYQIVSPDGQLSQALPESSVALAIQAGRLLATDTVKLSTGQTCTLCDVSHFDGVITELRKKNTLVDALGLSEAIGRICGGGQTGHLVLTGPDGIERAWSFVQGTMVGIRPLVPSDHSHENLTERSLTALYVGRNIVGTFGGGAMSIRYHEDSTYAPKTPQVHICGSEIIETGLRLGVGTTACLTALEEMGDLRSGRMGTSS